MPKVSKGEAEKAVVARVTREHGDVLVERAEREIDADDAARVGERHRAGDHAEVAAVVEQRQKARIQPRQRPDAEDEREHQERAGAEGLRPEDRPAGRPCDVLEARRDLDEDKDVRDGGRQQHDIVDDLVAVPADRRVAHAHRSAPCLTARFPRQVPRPRRRAFRSARRLSRSARAGERQAPRSASPVRKWRAPSRCRRGWCGGGAARRETAQPRCRSAATQRTITSGQSTIQPGIRRGRKA